MPVLCAETISSTNVAARAREDKSAAFTLALQAVQQLQTQQRATLQAVETVRQQAEAASLRSEQRVESLRRLLFVFGGSLVVVTISAVLYVRFLPNSLRYRGLLPGSFKCPLAATLRAQDNALDAPTANAFIQKGAALERLGRLDEALASYEQALALDASHADAYIGKGNVLNRLERYTEALACFEHAAHHQHPVHALPLTPHTAQ